MKRGCPSFDRELRMKRSAEKQLAKDDVDRDDEVEEVSAEGFRKASDTILATRPMRGLPKRSLSTISATTSQNATPEPEAPSTPAPKFGGFSGFGTPSNNAFAFTTPPAGASPFNITAPQPSLFKLPPSTQTVSSTASNTAKTFASFIGHPSSKPEPAPPQPSQPTAPPSTEAPEVDDLDLFKYYTSLRGLNVSFLDALSKATEQDPFADISNLLDRYKSLRLDVQKEYDEKSKKPSEPEKPSKPAAPKPTFMPAPPANFAGFGQSSTSTSTSSTTNGGGFQPKPTPVSSTSGSTFSCTPTPASAPTSPYSLPSPSTAQSSTSANPFVIAPSSAYPSPFGGPISNTSSLPGMTDKSMSSSSSLSFGTFSAPNTSAEKGVPSTSSFTFGNSSASGTAKFPFGTTEKSTSAPAPFSFATLPASSTGTSAFGNVATSSTTNLFGSGKPAFPASSSPVRSGTFGGFGGFGKSAGGSIGNPVGFGFGSPPKTLDTEAIVAGDTFSSDEANKKEDAEASEGGQDEQAKAGEGSFGLTIKHLHDEEGEGEEHEETVHAAKVKAYRFRKSDEKEGSPYLELGVGVLRLKKHKETEARRVLLRNSNTGKININFNLYAGLKPTQNMKALTFIGHDEAGASQTYTVRLQSEEQAILLKVAFEREIAFMTPKSED